MSREKTPDEVKRINGTDKKYRLSGSKISMQVVIKIPPAPDWFTSIAKRIYKDVARELLAKNLLHVVGLPLVIAYCNTIAAHLQLEQEMSTEGRFVIIDSKAGSYEAISPKHKASMDALEKALKIAVEFGFTPVSSQRIINQVTKQDDNDKFFD